MSAYKQLKDISNGFAADLQTLSSELFTVKVGDSFDEVIDKKLRDLSLYRSKLKLLRAKLNAKNPEITEQVRNERTTLQLYEETASAKVLEQQIVKFLTQSHSVKSLITAPSSKLQPEFVERKEKIIHCLSQYSFQESKLRQLDYILREKEGELDRVREQWDNELGELRDMRDGVDGIAEVEPGPLYNKLRILVDKMELMRWMISKLVTSRTGRYDWLTDPHKRLRALKVAREDNTMEKILES
ncbi:hypothetical protein evm_000265 [Chilo suppressalis]|nr:hypothetical protein evm_000265 [Chilo suppressalis]